MKMNPETLEDVITDFEGRRAAIVKALTHDFDKFDQLCDPNSSNSLFLYGFPDKHWDVNPPLNSELPEFKMAINMGKDSMNMDDWRSMVAAHSEVWLHAVAFYFAVKLKFNTANRRRLFQKIMGYPPISQVLITTPTMKMTRKMVIEGLPQELLILILSRLPVKDLLKYRCVSKTFRTLIDNPNFALTHLDTYNTNRKGSPFLVISDSPPFSSDKKTNVLLRSRETFRKVKGLDHVIEVPEAEFFDCLGYINGLMLLFPYHEGELILWNPSMNKYVNIPCPMPQDEENTNYVFGFGFDASCNDYKVIAVLCSLTNNPYLDDQSCDGSDPSSLQVYTLSTKSWTTKVGVHRPRNRISRSQVFFNGAIHWTNAGPYKYEVLSNKERSYYVVAFDVRMEVFSYTELPSEFALYKDGLMDSRLIVMDGFLGMFYTYPNDTHHIWVMEQYGVRDSWVIRYKFGLDLGFPLFFLSDGELLFAAPWNKNGVYSYDIKKKLLRKFTNAPYCAISLYIIYNYVESLVLL